MKILVLSLLRLGDIVLTAPALRGVREQNPGAEIHLMVNSQFRQIGALLPYIDRVIPFERERLQRGLGEATTPMFESYERLQDFVESLDGENYDLIVNLTQNRLSGWLMSVIRAKNRLGLSFDGNGQATFGGNWFRYLNFQTDAESTEVFHFADVFRFAMNVGEASLGRSALIETEVGRTEAATYLEGLSECAEIVCVQALTSDVKKDWGFERFEKALTQIQRVRPQARFLILGAPFEREKLQVLADQLAAVGVEARLAIVSFEGAFSLLKKSRLLLTGDTSIKHLACAAQISVVELALGSSDPYRTGAYRQGSLILKTKELCAPCVHSRPCHRDVHACARRLPAELVAMVVSEVLSGNTLQLRMIAEEYLSDVEILRVDLKTAGFWTAASIVEPFTEAGISRWIDLACRRIWLEPRLRRELMGTEILKLSAFLRKLHPSTSQVEWQELLGDLEKQAAYVEGRVNSFKIGLQHLRGGYEDLRRMKDFVRGLISFRERIRTSPLLSSYKDSLDRVIDDDRNPPFTRFRQMSDLVSEIENRTEIYLKLIRGLSQPSGREKGLEPA